MQCEDCCGFFGKGILDHAARIVAVAGMDHGQPVAVDEAALCGLTNPKFSCILSS